MMRSFFHWNDINCKSQSYTYENYKKGYEMNGTDVCVNLNECDLGTDLCSTDAECIGNDGSYDCNCNSGE